MESCSRCGTDKAVAERAPDGSPLCLGCSRNDPVNHGTCAECGRRARIVATVSGQPRCRRCRRLPEGICTLCGQRKPCHFAGTGRARCEACSRRLLSSEPCSGCGNTKMVWARLPDRSPLCVTCTKQRNQQECSGCGFVRPVTGRAPDGGALCRSCYAAHPVSFQECGQCGTLERLYHHGLCSTCAYHACLRDLLSGPDGSMRPAAEEVFVVLAGMNPVSAMAGLHGRAPGRLLAAIGQAAGPVTHEFLDGLQPQRGVQYLRARLVDAGVLPARDEQLIALQRWIDTVLGEVPDAGERAVLRRFLTWTYLRRLRGQGQMTTSVQAGGVRHQVRQVLSLLAWLRSRGRSLQTATQNDIDEWLADGPRIRREARVFAAWAARRGHSGGFEIPALPQENLRGTLMAETHRRSVLFRLLHDTSLDTSDRVAGLLVLLFALPLTRIAALEAAHVRHENGTTVLVLSEEPIVLPPPLDVLLRDLAAERASAGSRWLFPGGPAGQPISVGQLGRRVQRLGIRARPAHNATMMKIAADMPASVVGKFIGLHPTTAARWAGQAGAPRSAYAATLARRAARQAGNARPGYAAEVSRRNRR